MRISDWSSDVCSSDLEVEASTAWKRLAHLYRISDDVIGGCSAFLKASESTDPPLEEISKMANWLNNASAVIGNMDVLERSTLFKPLAALMEAHLAEARSEEHTSELQSLMRISYAVFCLKKKKDTTINRTQKQLE